MTTNPSAHHPDTENKPHDALSKALQLATPELYIGGTWTSADSGARFDVINPATEEVLVSVADGGSTDAIAALEAADAAQKSWAKTPPRERGEILRRAYERIMEHQEQLALLMTAEMGKPMAEAKGEVAYAAEFFRWFAEEAVRIDGDMTVTGDGKNRILVSKQPVGPCVLITPWNFPLAMGTRKIGPAIAAGCTMVFKPAALTPLSSLALAGILKESGLPDGVLNIVTTTDPSAVVSPWMDSGIARKISFTGSTHVGVRLLEQASQHVMRSSMELGGNAPLIVFDDADIPRAIDGALAAKLRNMGQACTAANRIFVHRNIIDTFATELAKRFSTLSVGNGVEPGIDIGPLVEEKALSKVEELVTDAMAHGAVLHCGGSRVAQPGYFYPPTVLSGVSPEAKLLSEEIFGPVAALIPFDSEEEVIQRANDTSWGLASYIFTQDVDRAFRVSEELEAGMVGLNTGIVSNPAAPFGGIKASGLGREGGRVGLDEFLEIKYLAVPRSL